MDTQTQTTDKSVGKELFIKMVFTNWEIQNTRVDKLLDTLTDEQLITETAPGRNSGIYIIGHLIAVNDGMLPLLGFGEKLYPELANIFLTNPDKSGLEKPSLQELKQYWKNINNTIREHSSKMPADEWFTKHTAISEEDFLKEPFRNKLNIVINRTNHQSYHLGQLVYLQNKG
ncbi:MAG: DinB family protein [Chitinophagaceae bacterium]